MLKKLKKIPMGNVMPKERFCMNWNILQGAKFISYVYTVFTALIVIALAILLANWRSLSGSLMDQVTQTNGTTTRCMSVFTSVFVRVIVRNFLILGIVFNSIFLVLCIGLVYGLTKGSKRFVKPWLAVEVVRLVICFLFFLLLCWGCTTLVSVFNYNPSLPVAWCIVTFVIMVVTLYFWLVVRAAVEVMLDSKKKQAEVSPAADED